MPADDTVLLLGATSLLGWQLARQPWPGRLVPTCNSYTRLPAARKWARVDLENADKLRQVLQRLRPAGVIYCSGVCKVEKCEANPAWARRVNVTGIANLLAQLPASTRLVYCSSDHVFSGDSGPYTEASPVDPLSVYGSTRVAAEKLVLTARPEALVLRLPLLIGPSADRKSGHLDWLQYRQARGLPMTLVSDEWRTPVWSAEAARRVQAYFQSPLAGLRHVVSAACVSRPQLAAHLCRLLALQPVFQQQLRADRPAPHLGRVELRTAHADDLATPLSQVLSATALPP